MDGGVVFNIQRFSIHDGPGIRTTVFLKGCPLRCFWCQNPESQSYRPEILLDRRKCTLCGACSAVCPNGAVRLEEGKAAFDRRLCGGCGRCAAACPNDARSLSGKRMTVDTVMHEVLKDRKFYENSGGGVTLSGGEPLAQPDFARQLFRECKASDLHTTLDTCGWAPWPDIEKVLAYADLVLFDIKHLDAARHREAAGQDNRLILENARRISTLKPMRLRVPLIPGFNDSPEVVGGIAAFASEVLGCRDVELLAYNRMGEVKYDFLDLTSVPLPSQSDDHLRLLESALDACTAASR
ncbi:MAG: glycyl-radical enzyme activating protein [Thermodesulfobacteriota bacterium]